jgi:hypothetical protein
VRSHCEISCVSYGYGRVAVAVEEEYAAPRAYSGSGAALNPSNTMLLFEGAHVRYERIFTSPQLLPLFKHLRAVCIVLGCVCACACPGVEADGCLHA